MFNMAMSEDPTFNVFEGEARFILFNGKLRALEDISRLFELDLAVVKRRRRQLFNDTQLMRKITEESRENANRVYRTGESLL